MARQRELGRPEAGWLMAFRFETAGISTACTMGGAAIAPLLAQASEVEELQEPAKSSCETFVEALRRR